MQKKAEIIKENSLKTLLLVLLYFAISFPAQATPVTTGLQLWLDASDAATITADGSNRVQQWQDKSGNARHATMTNNTYKPYTNLYTQNNLNLLTFTNDYMTVGGTQFSTTEMFFAYRTIYPYYTTTGCILCRESGAYSQTYITSTNTTYLQAPLPSSMTKDGNTITGPTFSVEPSQDFQVVRIHPSDDTSNRLYEINDRDGTRDRYMIGEILAYNGTLTSLQRLQIQNYLTNKWSNPYLAHTKYPANSSQSIGLTDNLSLTFGEPVFVDNGTMNIRRMDDDTLVEGIDLTSGQVTGTGTAVITFNPSASFANDTEYYVQFPAGKLIGMTTAKQFPSIQDRYKWHFKTERAAPEDFNPRHLDGLELWLDASDATTISTSGSRVTEWRDKSGNERDAFQTNNSYRPDTGLVDIFGQNALYFHDRYMDLRNDFFKSGTTIQVFRNPRDYFYNRSGAILGEQNSSFRANYIFYAYRSYFLAPYPSEVIKDTTTITPTPFDLTTTDEWMILTIDTPDLTEKPQQISTRWSTSYRSQNQIAEVISYNRYLSAAEKRQVIAYLQKKWGVGGISHTKSPVDDALNVATTDSLSLTFSETVDIIGTDNIVIRDTDNGNVFETIAVTAPQVTGNGTTTITINPTNNFQQGNSYRVEFPNAQIQGETTGYYFTGTLDPTDWDFTIDDPTDTTFDPTDIQGCELWLDASDTSTITLSGTRVTDWADKSGKDRDAYQTNNTYRPDSGLLTLDGKNVLLFHERYMDLYNGDFVSETIIQVFRNTYPYFTNRAGAIVGKRNSYDTDTYAFQTNQTYFANVPYPQRVQKDSVEISGPTFDISKTDEWMVLTTEQAFANSHRELQIGTRQSTSYRAYHQVAEVVVYNRKLSASELQQVTNYLQNKWKIGGLTHTMSPVDGEVNVGTTDNLTLTFPETVDITNGDIIIHNLSTGAIHETIDMTTAAVSGNGTTTVTINPTVNFATDSDYAVEMPGGKIIGETSGIDFAGKKAGQNYDWKFRSTDTDPNFLPNDIQGLELWFDSADATTMTLSGNNVTDWADKSNKGRDASQTTAGYQGYINTVTKNDHDVIRFYDDFMYVNGEDFKAKTIIQIFDTPYPYFWNRYGAILGRDINYFTQSYRFQVNQPYFNSGAYPESVRKDFVSVPTVPYDLSPMGDWMVLTITPRFKDSSRKYVINSQDGPNNRFYNDIAEVLVYNGELSDEKLVQVHNYLDMKWHVGGLTSNLDPLDGSVDVAKTTNLTMMFPENVDLVSGQLYLRLMSDGSLVDNLDVLGAGVTGNGTNTITFDIPNLGNGTDYYVELDQGAIISEATGLAHIGFRGTDEWNFRTINTGPFSPLDVQGIQLWYDAADAATITATGSKVTNWTDKSGRGRNATQTNASYRCDTGLTTINGLNAFYCDRGFMDISNGVFMTGDIFAVYRSHENYYYLNTSILGRSFPDLAETFYFRNRTRTIGAPFPKELSFSNKPITELELTSQGGVRNMRDWKLMMVHPNQDTITRDHKLGARWTGPGYDGRYDLAEVIAYDRAVSNGEKLQIFQYLGNKWHVGGPELVSSSPAADEVDVNATSTIQLVFDEAVDLVSGDLNIRRLSDDALIQNLPLAGATGNGTTTITFTPAAFSNDEEYYLELNYGQIASEATGINFPGFNSSDDVNFRTTDTDPSFSPEDISNLKVWLDANDPAGLTIDGNGYLQTWIDKSGHGNDFTQATPANRPLVVATSSDFDNKTTIEFDDSNDGMYTVSDYDLRYPYTVFIVANAETNPQGASRMLQGRDINWLIGYYNSRFAHYNEGWVNYDAADTITDNAAVLLTSYTNVNETMFYINGDLQVQNSTYRSSPGYIHLGTGGLVNEPVGGKIAEVLIYDRDLTSLEIGQVEAYLSQKWGLDLTIDVVNFTPPDDSSGFSVNGNLMIEFNQAVDIQTGNLDIFWAGNGNLYESISLNSLQVTGNGTNILTIDPTNNLQPLTSYYINITINGITDLAGDPYPGIQDTTTWNFVTDSISGKFSPRAIPDLELWLDASDYSVLYIAAGDVVSRWDDKSDNARFAIQTNNNLRPYANRMKRGGFNTLEFRFDYLDLNESDFAAEDIYHVYRSIFPTYRDYGSVLGSTSTSSAIRPYLFQSGNTYIHTNPNPYSVLVDNVPLAYPHYHNPIDELMTMTIRPRFPYVSGRVFRIGASGSYDAPVEIADLAVYSRQLSDSEREQLHDYFRAKWFTDFSPADDSTGVGITENLVISFTENVDILTGNLTILDMETDTPYETIDLNSGLVTGNGTSTITINPALDLATDTSYYVTVDSNGFESEDFEIIYKDLGGKQWWNFRTTNTTGSFDPRDIQGMELWFDAADNGTITEAANLVSLWEDKSGYSRDASSSGGERPLYNTVQLNGLDVIQSTGDSMNITDNVFDVRTEFTVKRQTTPTYNTYGAMLGRQSAGYRSYLYQSGQNYFYPWYYPDSVYVNNVSLASPYVNPNLDEFFIQSLEVQFPYDPIRYWRLLTSEGYNINQEVGEVIAYNRDLTAAERNQVYDYLFNKWIGIQPISFDPPDDSAGVLVGDNLDILFATTVDITNGDLRLYDANGGALIQTVDLNSAQVTGNGTTTISVDLPVDMSSDTDYYVEIDTGSIQDGNGNLYLGISDTVTWNFRTETTGPFDPRDIGGLQLWLDAQDASTITADGSNRVDTWLDKSGQGRDATMTNNSYKPYTNLRDLNGFNTMYFRDDYMDLANSSFVAGDIFVLMRDLSDRFYRYAGIIGPQTGSASYHHRMYYYRTTFYPPYPPTVWKDSRPLTDTVKDMGEINDYSLLMIEPSAVTTRDYYLNREPSHRGWREVAEVLVYNRVLTDAERIQVVNYMNDKWRLPGVKLQAYGPRDDETNVGLTSNLTMIFDNTVDIQNGDITIWDLTAGAAHEVIDINSVQVTGNGTNTITINPSVNFVNDNHYCVFADNGLLIDSEGFEHGGIGNEKEWNFASVNSTSNLTPLDVQGLELWLDAADTGTINIASGSNIDRWEDKTGFNHYAYQNTAGSQPQTGLITQNNLNVLNFPGGDYLTVDNGYKLRAVDIFEVYRSKTPDFNTNHSIVGTSDGSLRTYYFNTSQRSYNLSYTPLAVYRNNYLKSAPLFDLEEIDQFMQVEIQPNRQQRVHYRIGARETTAGQSEIAEVLIYNRELNDSERDIVSTYLQNKWYVGGPEPDSLDPPDGAIDVSITSNLTLNFSENVFIGNGFVTIRDLGDDSVYETININSAQVTGNGTTSILINPTLDFNNGDSYYVEIGEYAILNDIGIGMKGFTGNSVWNFSIEEPTDTTFDCRDVPGLIHWLDAADNGTITYGAGSLVSQWDDKSGYDRHASQSNATYHPDHNAVTLNGLRTLRFTGDSFDTVSNGDYQAVEIYQVLRSPSATFSTSGGGLTNPTGTIGYDYRFLGGTSFFATVYPSIYIKNYNTMIGFNVDPIDEFSAIMVTPGSVTDRPHAINNSTGARMNIDIAEICVYESSLNGSEQQAVFRYFNHKWDVSGPEPITLTPPDDDTSASLTNNLVMQFNRPIDIQNGYVSIYQAANGNLFERINVENGQVTGNGTISIQINPSANFEKDVEYYVRIDKTAFDDIYGFNYFGILDNGTWNFRAVNSGWLDDNWAHRIEITVPATSVNSDLTNFPVYLDLSTLPASFFAAVNSEGKDIRITTQDGLNSLPREIVSIDTGGNTGEVYFKAPFLSSTGDNVFYLYYNNPAGVEPNAANEIGSHYVWSNGYAAVYHMQEDPGEVGALVFDSTSNRNHLNVFGTMTGADSVAGYFGNAVDFDGGDDHLISRDPINTTGAFSISAWLRPTTLGSTRNVMSMINGNSLNFSVSAAGSASQAYGDGASFGTSVNSAGGFVPTGAWSHLAVSRNAGGTNVLTSNGNVLDTQTNTSATTSRLVIASNTGASNYFSGRLDEIRISNVERSNDWHQAEYLNLTSPSTFYTDEAPEALAAFVGPVLLRTYPLNKAKRVPISRYLIMEFDTAVTPNVGFMRVYRYSNDSTFRLINLTGGSVSGAGTSTITIDLGSNFESGVDYYVQIDIGGFEDLGGNRFAGINEKETWVFRAEGGAHSEVDSDFTPN